MHHSRDEEEPSRMECEKLGLDEVCALGVRDLRQLYRMRKLSPVEVTEATLKRIARLHGVPVAVKDIIRVQGTRTTAASRVLLDAPLDEADAPVVQRLRAAGAVLVGKLNLHEFAFGDPDADGPFGHVQNPRKLGHQ